jgi:hypothetical protein
MVRDIRVAKKCKWCGKKLSGRHHWLCDGCWTVWKKNEDQRESVKYGWR